MPFSAEIMDLMDVHHSRNDVPGDVIDNLKQMGNQIRVGKAL